MSVLVLPVDLAKRVKRGIKTSHRIHPHRGRVCPEVGDSLPIQVWIEVDGKPKRRLVCRVEVLAVEHGRLQEVTDAECRADGRTGRGEYFAWWRETVDGVEPPASHDEPRIAVPVWVVRFELDQRRFLSARPGITDALPTSDEARGYTTSPKGGVAGEMQGVSDRVLSRFVEDNWDRFAELRPGQSDEDEARRLAQKLKEVRKRAARTGLDVTLEVAAILHQIAEIERRLDEAA